MIRSRISRCSFLAVFVILPAVVVFLSLPGTVFSQQSERSSQETGTKLDLLKHFDPDRQVLAGEWLLDEQGLRVGPSPAARCVLVEEVPEQYDLQVEFVRRGGDDSVVVILPIGGVVSPALELGAWRGECHGLSRVNGRSARAAENPTAVRPGELENGRTYQLVARVRKTAERYSLAVELDGRPLFGWSGRPEQLQPNLVMNLPREGSLGLAVHNGDVVFSGIRLTAVAGTVPTAPSSSAGTTNAGEDPADWEPFNGGKLQEADEGASGVLSASVEAGEGDRGAFLRGANFSRGMIEVDLKGSSRAGSSFAGVVFHGVDGETYDAVYFRPFNFRHADPSRRGHAVQYMSHPQWPWNKLRAERPEEFESRADPEPRGDDWFHARVEVGEKRIRVYVDESTTPCLDVEKLGDLSSGKVGLWFNGTASFRNFRFTPAE